MKKLLTLIAISLCSLSAMANGVEIGGIHYILDEDNHTASVTNCADDYYSGVIIIPDTVIRGETNYVVTSIGEEAFAFCQTLTSVGIPSSVISIDRAAFQACWALKSINIPSSVTSIGVDAFNNSGLITIDIPSSVTSISDHAFHFCTHLTSVVISSSVISMGDGIFAYCSALTSIAVEDGNPMYDSRENCNAIIETSTNTLIYGCQHTIIPSTVTSIGREAFYGYNTLTSIEIPSSITSIEDYAFWGCNKLVSIEVPSSVISIGNGIVAGCSSLISIIVEDNNPMYDSRENCNAIIETSTNELISGCKCTIIPLTVTSIGFEAFYNCSSLISIDIPSSIISIGDHAFWGCHRLISVIIPSTVSSIGKEAFAHCYDLTSINIPSCVTSIGKYAFMDCGLISIDIPPSITNLEEGVFYFCSDLISIKIPSSVTSIEDYAFYSCSGMESILLPHSVASIGREAFYGCYNLASITDCAITPPILGHNVFGDVPRDIPLYVPAASIPLYQAADQWGEFDVQPLLVEIDPVTPQVVEMTWNPVDSASLYQLHLYTDSTSTIALDTILLINADSINGGIMLQNGTSVARRTKKIIHDAGGTIIVITIDPTSGTSEENPYKVTVSTVSDERIDVHFDMTVFQGTTILREESGTFVLNDPVAPTGVENLLAPSFPTGIYDLYGHRYPAEAWETLPAGVYVLREENRVEKVMKR